MSDVERKAPRADAPSPADSLPALVGRLGEDLMVLVDSKLSLLKIELKEDLGAYVRGGIRVGVGGLAMAVGFGCVSVAAALAVSMLLANALDLGPPAAYSAGFVVVGVVFMIGGLVVAKQAARRLMATELAATRSAEELTKDREWLRPGSP